jgi:SM-20-related protein
LRLPLRLALNQSVDVRGYAKAYAQSGIVRIGDVLSPASAEAVAQILEQQTPWQLKVSETGDPQGGQNQDDQTVIAARVAAVLERARSGFAFQYLNYPMIDAYLAGKDPGHPIHEVSEFLNGPEFLQLLRIVTGRQDIHKAMASATHYRPGDFLTWHDDSVHDDLDYRVCAYTLGFTRRWRADWGGQLLFHDRHGQIATGLAPGFNGLTLFSVPRAHSVATVAAYVGAPRLSIVGWGRSDQKS